MYAILLRIGQTQYLSLIAAFSLEDALVGAKDAFVRDNPNVNLSETGIQLELYSHSEMIEMFSPFLSAKVQKEEGDKNTLMKQIVETKDAKLFQENKALFTQNEQRYLRAEINK
jgi:hypothetical protein